MLFKENLNCNEIALNLNELCIEINKKATLDQGIKDFENIQNLIVYSIILATIYTLNIAPERIFMCNWLFSIPLVDWATAYDQDCLYPYLVLARVTNHYMKRMNYITQSKYKN